jgi:hypothetical protein
LALPLSAGNMVLASQDSALNTAHALTARLRASEAERERTLKRFGAGAAVVLVHILFLLLLLTGGRVGEVAHRAEPKEVLLLLPPLQPKTSRPALPPVILPSERPVNIPPTIAITPPPPAATQKPGDVMQAIGKELACGAGPYEHLTQAEREVCKRQPWHSKKNAKGVIVLDMPSSAAPPDDSLSGIGAVTQTMKTSDPCLAAGNTHTECIHKNIFGR